MKPIYAFLIIFVFVLLASGQKPDDVLATAKGHTIRLRDLSPKVQKLVAESPANLSKTRTSLFDQMITDRVLELEAKARSVTAGKLIANEKVKLAAPTEAEIMTFYTENRSSLRNKTLDEVRKPISDYLREQAAQQKLGELLTRLKAKYKFVARKEGWNPVETLRDADIVGHVNGQPITAKEFEDFARIPLFDVKADLADAVLSEVDNALYVALLADEAKLLGIEVSDLLAREVTDKMKEFSDAERFELTDDLSKRLFAKYEVKILYTAPEPILQNISSGNSPAVGPINAPVTIVMFSDFQCSACSATHPILKKAIAGYPGKIRFVVRSFPLESVHANAWRAAVAAAAANAQGKFFEYLEILYTHQDALDDASLKKYAADVGLNVKRFEVDFNSEKTAGWVRKDMADGNSYGVGQTPTIYVNGLSVRRLSADGFKTAIDKALGTK